MMPSKSILGRRQFIKTTAAAGVLSTGAWSQLAAAEPKAAIEKLNIACIGTANRASADIGGVKGESIVALCDIDKSYLDRASKQFPGARTYDDYREMLEDEGDKIDAVVVATADHHHAPASIRAIRKGKHVYCEKPLTHTVEEARLIAEATQKAGVATQMGTQIHAGENYRRVVEMIQSGAVGDVYEVHVWVSKGWGAKAAPTRVDTPPSNLNWELWIGPAKMRPYARGQYHPVQWRCWWILVAERWATWAATTWTCRFGHCGFVIRPRSWPKAPVARRRIRSPVRWASLCDTNFPHAITCRPLNSPGTMAA